jgi:TRAP-type mannitol/chloroaromatic compound transport system permease small subunit
MGFLLSISRAIDFINTWIGRITAWAIVLAILVSAVNAVVRKAFDMSSNAWLELQWLLFGAVFLLCASWTLISNEHIRIDIVSNLLPKRARTTIEYIGHILFLLPMAALMAYLSWPFWLASFKSNEQSVNAGGLMVWPAKFLIFLGFLILLLQSISEIIKRIAISTGQLEDAHAAGGHHAAAEAEAERVRKIAEEEAAALEAARAAQAGQSAAGAQKP